MTVFTHHVEGISILSSFSNNFTDQWRIQDFTELGAPTYDFTNFFQKLHKIERICTLQGRCVPRAPTHLDPPLQTLKN